MQFGTARYAWHRWPRNLHQGHKLHSLMRRVGHKPFKDAVKVHQTELTCGAPSAVTTDSADAAEVAAASAAGLLAAAPLSLVDVPASAPATAIGLLPRAS